MARNLTIVWWALDCLLFAIGLLGFIFPITLWLSNDGDDMALRRLILEKKTLAGCMVLGAICLISFALSLYGVLRKRKWDGLVIFNWSIVVNVLATTVIGLLVWYSTLEQRIAFSKIWSDLSPSGQQLLQDTLECCGYFDATNDGLFFARGGFCSNVAAGTNTTAVENCSVPILDNADLWLGNLFTVMFGYAAIESALFLANSCLINFRKETHRYRKIDEKSRTPGYAAC